MKAIKRRNAKYYPKIISVRTTRRHIMKFPFLILNGIHVVKRHFRPEVRRTLATMAAFGRLRGLEHFANGLPRLNFDYIDYSFMIKQRNAIIHRKLKMKNHHYRYKDGSYMFMGTRTKNKKFGNATIRFIRIA